MLPLKAEYIQQIRRHKLHRFPGLCLCTIWRKGPAGGRVHFSVVKCHGDRRPLKRKKPRI
nr:MAG TPA: hypothetical protein [Caudoviricetes sp.]